MNNLDYTREAEALKGSAFGARIPLEAPNSLLPRVPFLFQVSPGRKRQAASPQPPAPLQPGADRAEEVREKAQVGARSQEGQVLVPSRWDHWQAPRRPPLATGLAACLPAPAWNPQATPGLSRPWQPHPGSGPFQASLTFGPSSSDEQRGRTRGPPPSQTIFSPQGTRRAPSKGAWVPAGY